MTYVIAEPCIGVKDGSCADVCPVECIHTNSSADMYFIDPDECIDCGVCVPECPVDAIFPEEDLPGIWGHYLEINRDYFGPSGSPVPRPRLPPSLSAGAEVPLDTE